MKDVEKWAVTCPKCRNLIYSTKYGPKIKCCDRCGTTIETRECREIAIEGVLDADRRSDNEFLYVFTSIFDLILASFMTYGFVMLIKRDGIKSYLFMILLILVLFGYAILKFKYIHDEREQKKGYFEKETEKSRKRLENEAYVNKLKEMGYTIPSQKL